MKPEASPEWHVASLVVRHHADALPALVEAVAGAPGLDLALQDGSCSVLVQECDGTRSLMASIDLLQAVPGVITVNLVYHHVERQEPRGDVPASDPQESHG
ncbi:MULTISPECIES: chaperone NapD [unclassified Luteimonas]|uniref:chaperone NapD n=1 Tax=unclassified Luteimonas TaxID=2629088 RepID=UPI0018F0662F|nr:MULTISPECIES: chaperone NapD [unclassified Luteimonas]MBJ6980180.1 chaperone NapD [Luteimonas sp. MC1895]MBJ6985341.1 chaperone NapD [Luteimonas sp. MC1750]QQO05397.1 chaperone NapD [Luteimonas sp. MC1750]